MKRAPEKIFNIINHCACAYEQSLSCIQLFATPWTATRHPSLFMRFFRQEYWSGLPFPAPGDLPDPGIPHCRQILYCLSHQGSPFSICFSMGR